MNKDLPAPGPTRPYLLKAPVAWTLFLLDAALVAVVWPLALWCAGFDLHALCAFPADLRGPGCVLSDLLLLYAMGLYRREAFVETRAALSRIPLVAAMGAALGLTVCALPAWLAPDAYAGPDPRAAITVFALATACFAACAVAARAILDALLRRRLLSRRLLVVGAGARAWDLLRILHKEGACLNYEITFLHDPRLGPLDPRLEHDPDGRILRADRLGVLAVAKRIDADQIVVAPDERRGMDLEALLACKRAGFPLVQYLSFVEREIRRVDIKRLDLGWMVFSDGFRFGLIDRFLKRAFDLAVGSAVLVLTAPLLLLGVLAIRLEGAGPVFYRQERVTLDGTVFRIVKLRTMRVDAESAGAVWAAQGDSRITRVGMFLRRARIDELPQLFNILSGEMSFVGPRPERPVFVEELATRIPLYRERHMVKAGLTGWAQVNYPYGASVDDARSKLSYDLYYVKNFSILFDFVILLQTLRVVLWPSGVR